MVNRLFTLGLLLAPSVLAAPHLRSLQDQQQQAPAAAGGDGQEPATAFDSLSGDVTTFQPHFLPIDDSKLLPRGG